MRQRIIGLWPVLAWLACFLAVAGAVLVVRGDAQDAATEAIHATGEADRAEQAAERADAATRHLRSKLVAACRNSPVVDILTKQVKGEIERSRDITHADFPDIPLDRFRELIREGRRADQRDLKRLRSIDCSRRYQARP